MLVGQPVKQNDRSFLNCASAAFCGGQEKARAGEARADQIRGAQFMISVLFKLLLT